MGGRVRKGPRGRVRGGEGRAEEGWGEGYIVLYA
jgi:hypothetical protein